MPAPAAGVLAEIVLDTDAEAVPGALLARIETDGALQAGARREARSASSNQDAQPAPLRFAGAMGNPPQPLRSPRLPAARHRSVAHPGHRPQRASNARRRRPRGRVGYRGQRRRASDRPAAPIHAHDIPHDRMRLTIAENMARAVAEQPHVTAVFEADFSAVAAHKAAMAAKGTKLSYTAYIVKAAAEAMAVAPAINGRWEKTASRSRRPSTSGSAQRSARKASSSRSSRTPASSASSRSAQAGRPHAPRSRREARAL